MDQHQHYSTESRANLNVPMTETNNGEKSNKCNQCDYAFSQASNLRTNLKRNIGEKLIECNQCDYGTFHAGSLKTHFKTHTGEKPNKCNKCDYASSHGVHTRRHLKMHSGEKDKFENTQWRKAKQMQPM